MQVIYLYCLQHELEDCMYHYDLKCPKCKKDFSQGMIGQIPPKTTQCPFCKKNVSTDGAKVYDYLDVVLEACIAFNAELGDETFDR